MEVTAEVRTLLEEYSGAITQKMEAQKQGLTVEILKACDLKIEAIGTKMVAEVQKLEEERRKDSETLRAALLKWNPLSGSGSGVDVVQTLGRRITESAEYKAAQFNGRSKWQMTVSGPIVRKAGNTITTPGSGLVTFPQRIGMIPATPQLPLAMRDLLTTVPITVNAVEYLIENWNYQADYQVAEGDLKAQGDVTYTDATAVVRTIAWFVKISRQMLADVPFMQSNIDDNLTYGVLKKEDLEILFGNNAAGHLHGIMPQATPCPAAVLPGMANNIDDLAAAIAYLASQGYPPTAIVLNPMAWAAMSISKNAMGVYNLGGPPQGTATPTLWGLPVKASYNMPNNDYLVGSFVGGTATLFDRETVTVDIATENEDDFVRNLVTMRAEERICLCVMKPKAFVKGPFNTYTTPPAGLAAETHQQQPHAKK